MYLAKDFNKMSSPEKVDPWKVKYVYALAFTGDRGEGKVRAYTLAFV